MCLTNTDIKLDPGIIGIAPRLTPRDFWCLTRYEANGLIAPASHCTQDTWAVIGQEIHSGLMAQAAIPLGYPGCELRFAELFFAYRYRVCNPSLDIKNQHIQAIDSIHEDRYRICGAYLFTPPCRLDDIEPAVATAIPVYLRYGARAPTRIAAEIQSPGGPSQ
jgi:hypothetical protein